MVKKYISIIIVALIFIACSSDKSKEIEGYAYDDKIKLNEKLHSKVGKWIKDGIECYGVVVLTSANGNVEKAKTIKAKVVLVTADKIKMKALEDINLAPKVSCNKMGLSKGDTWWEEDGDLFATQQEATNFIKETLQLTEVKTGDKFTID